MITILHCSHIIQLIDSLSKSESDVCQKRDAKSLN